MPAIWWTCRISGWPIMLYNGGCWAFSLKRRHTCKKPVTTPLLSGDSHWFNPFRRRSGKGGRPQGQYLGYGSDCLSSIGMKANKSKTYYVRGIRKYMQAIRAPEIIQ
ncbi:hypothetical protein K493DRAFT_318812 [Basidiobolus meristosporus CBS 931.73]|uniref:Uncharacterized protein n=1 Tax=Basidiobolus meristosporus CBS 931.73 TaxID=1314790 RepID=A0A1Y1XUY3_9FUNG|nr:hypothetical protein K493DRAFT_318812 [Basidiobolus meristosporus CBS 931.73]|eukprot:ORX89296.1 hypothetical protein K493DRAFT_318812 [Basidiobolus meristosporus CBS 931.73]